MSNLNTRVARGVENPHSGAKGVFWHTRGKAWEVKMMINGQTLYGGRFIPKDSTPEEVECARLLAVESRRKLEFRGRKKKTYLKGVDPLTLEKFLNMER